jgi:hypothetical protein
MLAVERTLRAVPAPVDDALEPAGQPPGRSFTAGDLALTATILLVSLLPLVCDRLGVGTWSAGTLGLGAAGAALAARALWGLGRAGSR